jgi:soluble lytic murein transglycosylase
MKLSKLILIITTSTWILSAASAGDTHSERLAHALELLGSKGFKASQIGKTKNLNVSDFVGEATNVFLSSKHKHLNRKISNAILHQANLYGFDPIFLIAFIQNESNFNPKRKGTRGEIGLMQIKPTTAKWISDKFHINYKGEKSLYDPEMNLRIGTAYLFKLRQDFQLKSDLYLSAYNMGSRNVKRKIEQNIKPVVYKTAVIKRYLAIYHGFNQSGSGKEKGRVAYLTVANLTR